MIFISFGIYFLGVIISCQRVLVSNTYPYFLTLNFGINNLLYCLFTKKKQPFILCSEVFDSVGISSVKMFDKMEGFKGEKVIEEFEAMTKDAERVQRECLKKILEENGSAEYLQNFGLNGRTDRESYMTLVPLVTHKELEPYIQRIVDGDSSPVLTRKQITTISLRYS